MSTQYQVMLDGDCIKASPTYEKALVAFNNAKIKHAESTVTLVRNTTLCTHLPCSKKA